MTKQWMKTKALLQNNLFQVYGCFVIETRKLRHWCNAQPMSLKAQITEKIISLLKTLPKEQIKHYASFKDVQLERFQNKDLMDSVSEEDLKLQYISLRDLVNDKYKNYYKLDDKLLKPKGNPQYYERLLADLRGEKKETLGTAIRTVVFGKWTASVYIVLVYSMNNESCKGILRTYDLQNKSNTQGEKGLEQSRSSWENISKEMFCRETEYFLRDVFLIIPRKRSIKWIGRLQLVAPRYVRQCY